MIQMLSDHLWQSTVFTAVCWAVVATLRRNRAAIRYWVWFAASAKFLVPVSMVAALASGVAMPATEAPVARDIATGITLFSKPFTEMDFFPAFASAPAASPLASASVALLLVVWGIGAAIKAMRWARRRREILCVIRSAVLMTSGVEHAILRRLEEGGAIHASVRLVSSAERLEPGVFGYLRPVLFWPGLLRGRLSEPQIEAIMAHELCHVRRRDNLLASMHMVVDVVFWFHPAVWLIGVRLSHERERACDEQVIAQCSDPRTYAQTILKTCELCLEGPLPTYSGVTGPNLRSRIETILAGFHVCRMTRAQRALVVCSAVAACSWPLFLGFANAQSTPEPRIEVSTVKRNVSGSGPRFGAPSSGTFSAEGTTLRLLIQMAYGVQHFQILNAPEWVNEDRFDIVAKVEGVTGILPPGGTAPAVRALLADRFQLRVHHETREGPVWALVTEKSGHKLQKIDGMRMSGASGRYISGTMDIPSLSRWLSWRLERPVIDRTNLSGIYDIWLAWTPDPDAGRLPAPSPPPPPPPPPPGAAARPAEAEMLPYRTPPPLDPNGPSIFTAIREQLGLRLDAQRGPMEVVVIDRIERPTEN